MWALEPNTRAVHSFLMTELGQRRSDMAVDGPHRQHQSICELSVGQTLAEAAVTPPVAAWSGQRDFPGNCGRIAWDVRYAYELKRGVQRGPAVRHQASPALPAPYLSWLRLKVCSGCLCLRGNEDAALASAG
jgi:hypothetical protein